MNPHARAARLVLGGHVQLTYRTENEVRGLVRGRGGWYRTKVDPTGGYCTCEHGRSREAGRATCSHVTALPLQMALDGWPVGSQGRQQQVDRLTRMAGMGQKETKRR